MLRGSSRATDGAEVVAQSLARVLGDEAARNAVREAAQHLGMSGRPTGFREQTQLLAWLAAKPGLVGVAARRAQTSLALSLSDAEPARAVEGTRPLRAPLGADAIAGSELVSMFSSALGDEKAREMIEAECRRLAVDFERVPTASARSLLDELAKTTGIVGIAARFAKARLVLR